MSQRAGNLLMSTQLVSGGPPDPLWPGGRCQHSGNMTTFPRKGKWAGAAGVGEPWDPATTVSWAGAVGQPGRRPLVSQTCLAEAEATAGKWAAGKYRWSGFRQCRGQHIHVLGG